MESGSLLSLSERFSGVIWLALRPATICGCSKARGFARVRMLRSGKLGVPNKHGKKEVGKDLPVLFEDLPTPQISFSPR